MESLALVLITEIMYNPASDERPPAQTEWVEIYNPGQAAVSLEGWYLADEDGRTAAIAAGVELSPGEAAVLIPAAQSVEDFRAAWGGQFQVIPLEKWASLANSPSPQNEILTLRRSDDSVADEVNFDDSAPWPKDTPQGPSIYLIPGAIDAAANDEGGNWRRSEAGVHGAYAATQTPEYSDRDIGSPGTVVTQDEAAEDGGQAAEGKKDKD